MFLRFTVGCLLLLLTNPVLAEDKLQVVELSVDRVRGPRIPVKVVIENRSTRPAKGALCIFSWQGREWGRLSDRISIRPGETVYLDGVLSRPEDHEGPVPELAVRVSEYHLPDLVIERVTVPDQAALNSPTDVLVWVRNQGMSQAPDPELSLLSGDRVVEEKRAFDVLPPGRSEAFALRWVPEREGDHELRVVLDPTDRLLELREDNNSKLFRLAVGPARGSALTVSSFTIHTEQPRVGLPIKASVAVRNRGKSVVYRVPLIVRSGGQQVKSFLMREPVKPDQTAEFRLSWIAGEPGEQLFTVSADPEAPESFKNARARRAVTVLPAPIYDLRVIALEVPSGLRVGEECRLTARVTNEGELKAEGCSLRLVSDTGETVLVPGRFELGAQQTASVPIDWIPRQAGEVKLMVTAISEGAFQEADTADNQLEVTVKVDPGR